MPAEGSGMTQLESARRGIITPEMWRVAQREGVAAEFVAAEVARGRLVIPANKRHLAGSGGEPPRAADERNVNPAAAVGHPGATAEARLWVNQTVAQRSAAIAEPDTPRRERAPPRLHPTGNGRTVTTRTN